MNLELLMAERMFVQSRQMNREVINQAYAQALAAYVTVGQRYAEAQVLSVGCAEGRDADVQAAFVLYRLVQEGGSVHYFGIDMDVIAIQTAKDDPVYTRDELEGVTYAFGCFDAKNAGSLPGPYEVVFLSHPETYTDADNWKQIMAGVAKVQNPGGLLIAALYRENEVDGLIAILGDDYRVLSREKNEFARSDSTFSSITPYNYIVVAERK
jgi:2-polyprenyl-3-methyl-5-hydroxy-6-metoxy-1,4-benzoquinol methylase